MYIYIYIYILMYIYINIFTYVTKKMTMHCSSSSEIHIINTDTTRRRRRRRRLAQKSTPLPRPHLYAPKAYTVNLLTLRVRKSCSCFLHSPRTHVGYVWWNSEPDSRRQFLLCCLSAFLVFVIPPHTDYFRDTYGAQ